MKTIISGFCNKAKKAACFLLAAAALTMTLGITSCEDMLKVDTGDKLYVNANDTLYSYLGIMKCMQDIAERQVILSEVRGDLVCTTEYVTDTLYAIANFDSPKDGSCSMLKISDYYNVINNCNLYIHNADTSVVKSNKKYMLPEYAQVCAIRAWIYLQLVQNYGSVPFIVEPVSDLSIAKNFDYTANTVDKDNLVDKILETGIAKFIDTDYPNYGSFDNGAVQIASRKMMIPIRLILGDMYLLRGSGDSDYRQAAQYYYDYLKKLDTPMGRQYCSVSKARGLSDTDFNYSSTSVGSEIWGRWANKYDYTSTDDVISFIPSSSNKQFGTMLTRVADIYGYTPKSSQSTETSENEDGDEETSTSGIITVTRNYKSQTTPSGAYQTVNNAQTFIYYDNSNQNNPTKMEYESGDARFGMSVENFAYENDSYTLCSKASKGSTFYYVIPIYRRTLVWLRLAEAINRAGFPQMAFAILKDGINYDNLPVHSQKYITHPLITEQGDTILDDSTGLAIMVTDTIPYLKLNGAGAMYYVDSLELDNFFLSFTDDIWTDNYGIHARGCGFGSWNSTELRTNLTGYNDSVYYDYNRIITDQGYDPTEKEQAINAIENAIVDELALELAFEGYRFTDLVRIANHKEASGYKGTEWLAAKIADRGIKIDRFKETRTGERDQQLYNKLLDRQNWYFQKP